jgi:6-pyruvoyltetrahydropterin/6-carboxytetrahydropterin synthase
MTVPNPIKIVLTRRYNFAASHRLHNARFSEEENRLIYGKCSNPYGHGHNYVIEVSVSGAVDPATGMIANLADLDGFVEREVLNDFDHRYLNEEVAIFNKSVPTSENLCIEIYKRLKKFPNATLEGIRLEETGLNSVGYSGEGGVSRGEI